MTIEFQKSLIRYLFQYNSEYLEYISADLFDTVELRAIFELYRKYRTDYKSLPDRDNFIEFVSRQQQLDHETIQHIKNSFTWIYRPLKDVLMIEHTLIEETKKKRFANIVLQYLKKREDGLTSSDLEEIHAHMSKIIHLDSGVSEQGLLLLKDLNKVLTTTGEVYPTFLRGLNDMMATGGFQPPELIVFMGPPKSFKTGFLIKFGIEYMKAGLDVFYADFENGRDQIMQRFKQGLLECHMSEISDFNNELNMIKDKLLNMTGSGEVFIKKYLKRKDHFGHIESDLKQLIDSGVHPKVMLYDYINIMGCSDKSIKEPRLKIQHNYAEASRLNDIYGTFALTVSKMKSSAIHKEWPGAEDVAEDFEIIYNAHKVFAIMRSEEDIEEGLGRMIPIVQRSGTSYTKIACTMEIDAEKFIVREL